MHRNPHPMFAVIIKLLTFITLSQICMVKAPNPIWQLKRWALWSGLAVPSTRWICLTGICSVLRTHLKPPLLLVSHNSKGICHLHDDIKDCGLPHSEMTRHRLLESDPNLCPPRPHPAGNVVHNVPLESDSNFCSSPSYRECVWFITLKECKAHPPNPSLRIPVACPWWLSQG